MDPDDNILNEQISRLVKDTMDDYVAIKGISIGTDIATNILTKMKPELNNIVHNDFIASATSFQYISRNLLKQISKDATANSYVTVGSYVVILNIVKEVSGAIILDRKLIDFEGNEKYKKVLQDLLLKVSAQVETSGYKQEDPIVKIMRAVPPALFLALISKEGLPLKIIETQTVAVPMVSSQVAALSNLTKVMLKEQMDYAIIDGKDAHILLVQYDNDRIIILAIPDNERMNMGEYLARVKQIIENTDD